MSAYVIFDVDVYDPDRYQDFISEVQPVLASFGGKYCARNAKHKVYEGEWQPRRIVMFQFPSMEAFDQFYSSDAYQSVKAIRDECSSARIVSFEGISPPL